jgi:hypothetical protein
MSVDQARRGRPKGSGLDDRENLRAVTRLLVADPALKPTTAIKALGITDPSSIRRLRDKLRTVGSDASKAAAPAPGKPANPRGVFAEAAPVRHTSAGTSAVQAAPQTLSQVDPVSWLAAWCGLGLQAFSSTVEAQMAAMESLLRLPHVASALKTHVLLSEHVLEYSPSKRHYPRVLH